MLMNILNNIKRATIIVCNSSYKQCVLNNVDKLYNLKFFDLDSFIEHYYFSYDELTIQYLMKYYYLSYDNAVNYLNQLLYVSEDCSDSNIAYLVKIKNDLIQHDLLYFDASFKEYISNFDIFFVGIPYFTKLQEDMISELRKLTVVEIYDCLDRKQELSEVFEADCIDDEVEFVCDKISTLISLGVKLENIKITNIDDDYTSVISKVFGLYKIPINVEKHYLYSLEISKLFLDLYDKNDLNQVFDVLFEKYPNDDKIIHMLIDIVNKYVLIDDLEIKKQFIINDMKHANIIDYNHSAVQVVDYMNDYFADEDYVFLLNFNQGAIPIIKKDEDYITDDQKSSLMIDTTNIVNIKIKNATIKILNNLPNLLVTYKKQTPYANFFPSSLINEMNLKVKKVEFDDISYSDTWSKIKLSKMINKFVTYGEKDNNLALYYNNFPIDYMTYNNKFTGIDKKIDNITLSYSTMNKYYLCKFQYYVANVLGLDIFMETFAAYIGSFFHYVLQYHFRDEIPVLDLINKYLNDNPVKNKKEEYFVNNLKKDIMFVVDAIHKQLETCKLNKALYEEKVTVKINGRINVTFKGFIDKLLYTEKDGKMIVAIIDYKTGNTEIDLALINYGLSLQLPVYLYLAKNSDKLSNITCAGFYLQKILHEPFNIDEKQDLDTLKYNSLKLNGYSNSDEEVLSLLDSSYKDSRVIKSMKLNNSGGFNTYSKVLNNSQFNNIVDLVNNKILEASDGIALGDYEINPKKVNNINISCQFCNFKDICFKTENDFVELKKDHDLSFLGGDIDA